MSTFQDNRATVEALDRIAQREYGYIVVLNLNQDRASLVPMESGKFIFALPTFGNTDELATFLITHIENQNDPRALSLVEQLLAFVDPRMPLLNLNEDVATNELLDVILQHMKPEDWDSFRPHIAQRSERFLEAGDVHFQRLKLQALPEAQGSTRGGKRL